MTLDVRSLRLRIDGRDIVDDADFEVPRRSVVALVGPNGAGKSSLLRLVAGSHHAGPGEVHLDGEDLLGLRRRDRARRVALVEQSAHTDFAMTVRQVVRLGRIPFQSVWEPTGDSDSTAVTTALLRAGALDLADRQFTTLSGGEQQRVHLARALAQEPRLLLLDEPTNHLDVGAQLSTLAFLRELAGQGVTVLAALHDLNLAAAYCDHVVVMSEGRVIAAGPTELVLRPELIEDVYGVRADVLTHPRTGRPLIAFSDPRTTSEPPAEGDGPYDDRVRDAGVTQGA